VGSYWSPEPWTKPPPGIHTTTGDRPPPVVVVVGVVTLRCRQSSLPICTALPADQPCWAHASRQRGVADLRPRGGRLRGPPPQIPERCRKRKSRESAVVSGDDAPHGTGVGVGDRAIDLWRRSGDSPTESRHEQCDGKQTDGASASAAITGNTRQRPHDDHYHRPSQEQSGDTARDCSPVRLIWEHASSFDRRWARCRRPESDCCKYRLVRMHPAVSRPSQDGQSRFGGEDHQLCRSRALILIMASG
jgi:hypothetical protein